MSAERWCWREGPLDDNDDDWFAPRSVGSTCILPDGHNGDHEFTPDDQITFRLVDPEAGR